MLLLYLHPKVIPGQQVPERRHLPRAMEAANAPATHQARQTSEGTILL